jgi:hypothetical protein
MRILNYRKDAAEFNSAASFVRLILSDFKVPVQETNQ